MPIIANVQTLDEILASIGIAVGLAGAFVLTRWTSSLLFEVSSVDPMTDALQSVALVGVALLASHLPARRAAATGPNEAFSWE